MPKERLIPEKTIAGRIASPDISSAGIGGATILADAVIGRDSRQPPFPEDVAQSPYKDQNRAANDQSGNHSGADAHK